MDNRSLSSLYIEQDEPTSSSGKTAAAEGRAKVKKEAKARMDGLKFDFEQMAKAKKYEAWQITKAKKFGMEYDPEYEAKAMAKKYALGWRHGPRQ